MRHYTKLVENDVAEEIAERLLKRAADQLDLDQALDPARLKATLRVYIAQMVPADASLALQPGQKRRVAFVGPSGSGKSSTVVKLAALLRLRQNLNVGLLSLDMHRLDAHEHLKRYAEAIDVPARVAQTIGDVKQGVRDLADVDVILIDTPGVGLREQGRFARTVTLLRAARPDETHLVLPASLDPRVQTRFAEGFSPLGPTRVVLTRLDDVVGTGVILNVVDRLSLGLSFMTSGQNVPNDIEEACGQRIAELLCPQDD